MVFAQFFHNSTGWNGKDFSGPVKLIEACGSDSVALIDGRYSIPRAADTARQICKARKFKGFTLNAGEAFSRSRVTRKLESI